MKQKQYIQKIAIPLLLFTVLFLFTPSFQESSVAQISGTGRQRTVNDIIKLYEHKVKLRLSPHFQNADLSYPPTEIALIAYKDQKKVNLLAKGKEEFRLIKSYSIQAASGRLGPKLQEGDFQVPEGIYKIQYLNPNSSYHLSMKLNYPNTFDSKYAKFEGRTEPGTDIFIHGKAVSTGCLAMGDTAVEELFVLVNKVGLKNVEVIITPTDVINNIPKELIANKPIWVSELYGNIKKRLMEYDHSTLRHNH